MTASNEADSSFSWPHADRTGAYRNRFLLSDRHNLCYAAVDKAACTTMKWWLAEMEGIRDDVVEYLSRDKDPKGVHHAYGGVAPHLVPRSFGQIRAVFASGRYFCFSVVRNPYTRLFSAWSDKILEGRNDAIRHALGNSRLYAEAPLSLREAQESLEKFLVHLHETPGMLHANRHWMPQFFLLRPDLLSYNLITRLEAPDDLRIALAGKIGREYIDPFMRERAKNSSQISYHPEFLSATAARLIRELYADDFARFGYDPDSIPPGKGELDVAKIKKQLVRLARQRIGYAYRRLARLEREKRDLRYSASKAFQLFVSSLKEKFRVPLERLLYSVSRRLRK
jgi:Sulfotransferase family.